eukprot:TRINITY_DN3282_c0_g1_i5.p1 TRINITY_DN3282_c0_g1~~TRINITY_DN3282_c0_g1_i5.p1  ORF type:complete len:229 (-),score=40.03 TRINITY_DN3282_c0_g1_i5:379-1065(-)
MEDEVDAFRSHPCESAPIMDFVKWYQEALSTPSVWANNFVFSTVDADGQPHSRLVSLHSVDERGFMFCCNYSSPKSQQLEKNPKASMLFQWEPLFRQVRITGTVKKLTREESTLLYTRRGKEEKVYYHYSSQGAHHRFNQSKPLSEEENKEYHAFTDKMRSSLLHDVEGELGEKGDFIKNPLGPPENWGGYCLAPNTIEFLDLTSRFEAMRKKWTLLEAGWSMEMLAI